MPRTWFITGTSSGFGRLLVVQLLARGDRVAATLRDPARLDDLAASAGDRLWIGRLDVTDRAQVRRVVDEAFAALGEIDVVVGNAGYGLYGAAEEATDAQVDRMFDTNLTGSLNVIRAVLPHLRAQGHGRIVQVSSAGGQTTYPNFSYYHAAKWGVEGFLESLAQEVAAFGIGVSIIEPGATQTGFGAAVERTEALAAYASTPSGEARRMVDQDTFVRPNDAERTVTAMLAALDDDPVPVRVPLGVDTYRDVRASLLRRLSEHEAQEQRAMSVAADSD